MCSAQLLIFDGIPILPFVLRLWKEKGKKNALGRFIGLLNTIRVCLGCRLIFDILLYKCLKNKNILIIKNRPYNLKSLKNRFLNLLQHRIPEKLEDFSVLR